LLSGLDACTAITLRMYAEGKGWALAGVDVKVTDVVRDQNNRWIDRLITLHGVDDDQRGAGRDRGRNPRSPWRCPGNEIRTTTEAA